MHSPPDSVDVVHQILADFWKHCPIGDDDRMAFELALVEVAGNVFEHTSRVEGLTCICTLAISGRDLTAELRDDGDPVVLTPSPSPDSMPDELAESGRGLPLIRALVHELDYRRDGDDNVWTIALRLGSAAAP